MTITKKTAARIAVLISTRDCADISIEIALRPGHYDHNKFTEAKHAHIAASAELSHLLGVNIVSFDKTEG